jgi:COP9 signalosome complex subunit 4
LTIKIRDMPEEASISDCGVSCRGSFNEPWHLPQLPRLCAPPRPAQLFVNSKLLFDAYNNIELSKMASPNVTDALKQTAASSDKPQDYESLISQVHLASSPSQLPGDLNAIIDAIFADALGIVATRSLCGTFIQKLKTVPSNETKTTVGEHALEILQAQASSFEEQNAQVRELMATAYEEDEDNLAAAKVLAGIPLESSQRKVSNEDKVRFWIRITRNYLEVDDTTLAEQYLNKAKNLIYTVSDRDLNLHFKLSQARIQDARRNFLAAAQGYQDISLLPIIGEEERLHTLSMAIKCSVLAPAGPLRSRALGRLYKDERATTLEEYPILEKMFLDRLLSPEEVAKFAEGLATHQLARTSDGSTVLAKAVVEHNLRGASRLYNNIGFDALGLLLGLDGDKAEETTARMIEQGRLVGRIDQVERVIWFEGGEATGEKGSGRAEGVVGKELRRWDSNVQGLAEEVEKVTSELQLRYPVSEQYTSYWQRLTQHFRTSLRSILLYKGSASVKMVCDGVKEDKVKVTIAYLGSMATALVKLMRTTNRLGHGETYDVTTTIEQSTERLHQPLPAHVSRLCCQRPKVVLPTCTAEYY